MTGMRANLYIEIVSICCLQICHIEHVFDTLVALRRAVLCGLYGSHACSLTFTVVVTPAAMFCL